MDNSIDPRPLEFKIKNGAKIKRQWTLGFFLLIGAALWSSAEAAQFSTSDCPAGSFYKTGTKYFEEKSYYDKPRLVCCQRTLVLLPSLFLLP